MVTFDVKVTFAAGMQTAAHLVGVKAEREQVAALEKIEGLEVRQASHNGPSLRSIESTT